MVSPSKPHHSRVASQEHLHKCKLVKGPKPLTHFKFYLDIEKHHIENKIEKTIRELGGSIEFFLAKTVTHFVTDKPIDRDGNLLNVFSHYLSPSSLLLSQHHHQAKTPSPAPKSASHVHDLNNSDEKRTANSRPKSRADAMVQRARTTTQPVSPLESKSVQCAVVTQSPNPVQLAQNWGKTIWNTEYTLKFLEKVTHELKLDSQARTTTTSSTKSSHHHHHHHHHHQKTANVKHLNGEYIKIESKQEHYRPYYQEFSSWPQINLDCTLCPFQNQGEKTVQKPPNNCADQINTNNKSDCKKGGDDDNNDNDDNDDNGDGTNVVNNKNRKLNKLKVKASVASKTITSSIAETTATSVSIQVLAKNKIANIIDSSTMTRKTRNKQVREAAIDACSIKTNNDDVKPNSEKCGYCEKCRMEYEVLAHHLQSKEHLNFVKNNDNYIALDSLINSGTNVENFLRINSGHQIIDESERNGVHSPKRDSLITTRVNYLSHTTTYSNNDGTSQTTVSSSAATTGSTIINKSHKQMNGVAHHHNDRLSPTTKFNNVRDKLPKYSPPITRRSQTKNSTQTALDDSQINDTITATTTINSSTKFQPHEKLNSISVDCKEHELNFISKAEDTNVQSRSPTKQTKTTINGKKKIEEPAAMVNDDSPQMAKRLVRAFPPRYKVIDGYKTIARPRNAKSNANNRSNIIESPKNASAAASKDLSDDEKGVRDPITGLIVKFKRVRESELTKLTYEADNFMFPKREELPTDEDRQSTSDNEHDASSELLSSEISGARDSFSTPNNTSLNVSSTTSDGGVGGAAGEQLNSTGRRKKRRSQYDTFKSPATSRQKFRVSLIQSRLSAKKAAAAATANGSQTPLKSSRRSAKLSLAATKSAAAAVTTTTTVSPAVSASTTVTKVGRRGKRQREPTTVSVETLTDNSLDDRMGENSYMGGRILNTDYFKNLKFSFERVPSNEPWYLTFQRQDEHRERMFEYWGNTAYRKLPYELGPLPPLPQDCCILSKITAIKQTKQQTKSRRSTKTSQSSEPTCSSKLSAIIEENAANGGSSSSSSGCINRPGTPTTKQITIAMPCEENDKEKRTQTTTLSQLLLADTSLNSISSLPPAISGKKKAVLLDAFGQPRKSPREHASTLSILSSLVQQRRKRIKDMNGGISPEKMPSYKAAVAAAIAAQQRHQQQHSTDVSENEDMTDECESRLHIKSSTNNTATTTAESMELKPMSSRRRSNQTPVFDINKSNADTSEPQSSGGYHSMEQSDKIFRLRKGKRRQTESVSSNNESVSGKQEKSDDLHTNEKILNDADIPKIPVDEYIDPNKLVRDIDELLSTCYLDSESDLNNIPVDSSDLILVNTSKDFVDIIESVKDGPLTYRSLQRGKKRHINKTGWPSLPRKRLPKREKVDDVESALSDVQNCESCHSDTENDLNDVPMDCENDSLNHVLESAPKNLDDTIESTKNSPIPFRNMSRGRRRNTNKTDDDADDEKSRTALRQDRRRIRTPFCDDNAVQFVVSASSSEKAENSDIFTVSSDSFLDADANDTVTVTTAKSRLSADSRLSAEDDGSILSDETTVNHQNDWRCRSSLRSNSITDEVTKQQKAFPSIDETAAASTTTSILERTLKNMSTRSKFLRSPPTLMKDTQIDLKLQPLVCVQKIPEKDLPQKHWINNLSPLSASADTIPSNETSKWNSRSPTTPTTPTTSSAAAVATAATASASTTVASPTHVSPTRTKTSPRKMGDRLRKPRGRWYRER